MSELGEHHMHVIDLCAHRADLPLEISDVALDLARLVLERGALVLALAQLGDRLGVKRVEGLRRLRAGRWEAQPCCLLACVYAC